MSGDTVLDFGKHRGQRIRSVPIPYLQWLADAVTNRPAIVDAVRSYLLELAGTRLLRAAARTTAPPKPRRRKRRGRKGKSTPGITYLRPPYRFDNHPVPDIDPADTEAPF